MKNGKKLRIPTALAAALGVWLGTGAVHAGDAADHDAQAAQGSTFQGDIGNTESGTHSGSTATTEHGSDASTGLTGGDTEGNRDNKTAAKMVDDARTDPAGVGVTAGNATTSPNTVGADTTPGSGVGTDTTPGSGVGSDTTPGTMPENVDTTRADRMGSGAAGRASPGYEGAAGGTGHTGAVGGADADGPVGVR